MLQLFLNQGVVMGVDEAGRGPTLGPMVYAAAFWHPASASRIPADFNDSKQLSNEKRAALFEEIRTSREIGFVLRVLHASEISRNMLRRLPYNLVSIAGCDLFQSCDVRVGLKMTMLPCSHRTICLTMQ